jgi:hypothetical protein
VGASGTTHGSPNSFAATASCATQPRRYQGTAWDAPYGCSYGATQGRNIDVYRGAGHQTPIEWIEAPRSRRRNLRRWPSWPARHAIAEKGCRVVGCCRLCSLAAVNHPARYRPEHGGNHDPRKRSHVGQHGRTAQQVATQLGTFTQRPGTVKPGLCWPFDIQRVAGAGEDRSAARTRSRIRPPSGQRPRLTE